jgi:hypothetical protein
MFKEKRTNRINFFYIAYIALSLSACTQPIQQDKNCYYFNELAINIREGTDTDFKNCEIFYSFYKSDELSVDSLDSIFFVTYFDTINMTHGLSCRKYEFNRKHYEIAYSFWENPERNKDILFLYEKNTLFLKRTKLLLVFPFSKKTISFNDEKTKISFFLEGKEMKMPRDLAELKIRGTAIYKKMQIPFPPKVNN